MLYAKWLFIEGEKVCHLPTKQRTAVDLQLNEKARINADKLACFLGVTR